MTRVHVTVVVVLCLAIGVMTYGCEKSPPRGDGPKIVILGFDGADPQLLSKFMMEGKTPHLAKLGREGTFTSLVTTNPPESPVAWASFATGVKPGKHSIYDFLKRDPQTYFPDIAGVYKEKPKFLWGIIPYKPPVVKNERGGTAFWVTAGKKGVRSEIIKVPMNFPPTPVPDSKILAGLGVPDVKGTQGTYFYWATDLTPEELGDTEFGGKIALIYPENNVVKTTIEGPWDPTWTKDSGDKKEKIKVPFEFTVDAPGKRITFDFQGQHGVVDEGQWSDWYTITFNIGPFVRIHGMMKFYLIKTDPEIALYMTPINFDPHDPPFPISAPEDFSGELASTYGIYKTTGWEEETMGLNEERIDEAVFLDDVFTLMDVEEDILIGELKKTNADLFVAVFTATDRVAHMFFRLIDPEHPMYDAELASKYAYGVEKTYKRMDDIVGATMKAIGPDTTLFIVSDHGFHTWRRGLNINTWLVKNGFMFMQGQIGEAEDLKKLEDLFSQTGRFFQNVDWTRTQAYSLGLGQIYINLRGREKYGVVSPGEEYEEVTQGIIDGLRALRDPAAGNRKVVADVFRNRDIFSKGPYYDASPDLQVAFASGYRVSWQTALGGIPPELIEDNDKKWSGDHCSVAADDTGGILLSNRVVKTDMPTIYDVAPTVLTMLNVPPPGDYDGRPWELAPAQSRPGWESMDPWALIDNPGNYLPPPAPEPVSEAALPVDITGGATPSEMDD